MSAKLWTGLGDQQEVTTDRQLKMRAEFDRRYQLACRHGDHLWQAFVAFFVQVPLKDGALLDAENMAQEPAIGCYICEEPYSERLATRRCKGEPS